MGFCDSTVATPGMPPAPCDTAHKMDKKNKRLVMHPKELMHPVPGHKSKRSCMSLKQNGIASDHAPRRSFCLLPMTEAPMKSLPSRICISRIQLYQRPTLARSREEETQLLLD